MFQPNAITDIIMIVGTEYLYTSFARTHFVFANITQDAADAAGKKNAIVQLKVIRYTICNGSIPIDTAIGTVAEIIITATTILIMKFVINTVITSTKIINKIGDTPWNIGVNTEAKNALIPAAGLPS